MENTRRAALVAAVAAFALGTATVEAVVVPQGSKVAEKSFHLPELFVTEVNQPLSAVPSLADGLRGELSALGVAPQSGFFDSRTGRWSSLVLSRPLIPGDGFGNHLTWDGLAAPAGGTTLSARAWEEVTRFVGAHESQLRVDVAELGTPRVGVFEGGALIQIHSARVVGGVPVRDSGLTAVVSHGNLLLLGLQNWADVGAVPAVALAGPAAREVVERHLAPFAVRGWAAPDRLELIPTLQSGAYAFRLAWVVSPQVEGDLGSWEGLVDAVSGDLLQFEDKNLYASRQVAGGVFPVSNDLRVPDGIEQLGWPMPFVDFTVGTATSFATSGGTLGCLLGSGTSTLAGRFVRINDACGPISEPALLDLDLGLSIGTDCTVPLGHSAGNTHSARTGYYELNRLVEQAKGYLPSNPWLQAQLTANMNVNLTCNAFWSPATQTVNFYRDNGSACRNTGEIAAVFDHEWGHGLDDNGVNGTISSPGEAIADIHAILRLSNSCVGRGFQKTAVCGGYGDACNGLPLTGCTGVRDSDFANHRCNLPHTVDWVLNGFSGAQCLGGATACQAAGSRGPCNRETHCEGQIAAEVAWDLQARDLRAPPFNLDANTSLELTTRLFYLAGETVTNWYACDQAPTPCQVGGTCGCGATGGYLLVLAADDDNGNLADGTPHMSAIRAAFERHQLHCATQAVLNSGCVGGPTLAPVVTAIAGLEGVTLNWAAVPGATKYDVYRTEGLSACAFGKVKIGETTATTFVDAGLLALRLYSYIVLPVGANTSCLGKASLCVSTTALTGVCGALTVEPNALAVDRANNGVFEPGETALIEPQWRNAGLLGLNLSGSAYNLSGPAGGTYTLGDGSGIYGLMLPGTPQSCIDCYQATIGAPARPALHWDAHLTETVLPSFTSKDWVLHLGDSFTDVTTGSIYYKFIETILHKGVTAGCTNTTYCPSASTAREQMAVFVLTSKEAAGYQPPACTTPVFADVPASSIYCRWIEELSRRGVTGGCGGGNYCPGAAVTREQMAVFVLRTLEPTLTPPACAAPNLYSDVPETSIFCPWIEELTNRGVVVGCGGGRYCPSNPVTREEMAVFLTATFGLTLYGL